MRGENRKDRKKDVKLKAGRRPLAEGESDPRTKRTRQAMATAAEAIVREEKGWPTLAAVSARTGLGEATVNRNTDALDPARRLYLEIVGPYPAWNDPLAAKGTSPSDAHDADHEPRTDAPAAGAGTSGSSEDASARRSSGPSAPLRADDAEADTVDGGPASREAGLQAELKLMTMRVERLEREVKAERQSHQETRRELATARLVADRLLNNVRPAVPEYKPLSDDMKFPEDGEY